MGERILVVDDESDVCFVLKEVLSEGGFVVDSYKDPLLALSNFKAHFYSLVILSQNAKAKWFCFISRD
jgi:DNA-binding response OmpR family regulator